MSRHKTPLRYPGGKQKLAPFFSEIIDANSLVGGEYAEPYAGGAGVAIELLLSGKVSRIHLNDSCRLIYAFWRSILTKPREFCRKIAVASLTVDEWRRQREIMRCPQRHSQLDVAFSLFYLNRCNRSGIATGGVIGGLEQRGAWKIDARFTRNELIQRIEAIASFTKCITVKNLDAEQFIEETVPRLPKKTLVYFDPPYFKKAERLYHNHYSPADHKRIAKKIQKSVKQPWVVSYDDTPEIRQLFLARRSLSYFLQYNAAKAYRGKEQMFFSDGIKLPSQSKVECINDVL